MGRKLFSLLFLLLLLVSCRTREEVEPTPGGAVTISLAVEEQDRNYYHPIVEAFEQEHPDIHVRLISTSEIVRADDENEIRALARAVDIFPHYINLQDSTQYLLDLRPLIEADRLFNPNDFFPNLLNHPSRPQWSIPVGVYAGRVIAEAARENDFSKEALNPANEFLEPRFLKVLAENKKRSS